jgi:hypothetical protein
LYLRIKMKKLLLILLVFTTLTTKAQTVVEHPFPIDSAAWVDVGDQGATYFYRGDTLVDGIQYKKAYFKGYYPDTTLHSLLRVDSNRVYIRRFWGGEVLIYDYNILVGESFTFVHPFLTISYTCVLIDSVLTNTGYRKQWNFTTDFYCETMPYLDTLKWIEGITSNIGVFYDDMLSDCNTTDTYSQRHTQCFMHRDTMVLGNGSCLGIINELTEKPVQPSISIFPNPATTEFTVRADNAQKLIVQLYNLTGQQLGSYSVAGNQLSIPRNNLPSGMYIVQIQAGNLIVRNKVLFTD